jgi:hypothetical protein
MRTPRSACMSPLSASPDGAGDAVVMSPHDVEFTAPDADAAPPEADTRRHPIAWIVLTCVLAVAVAVSPSGCSAPSRTPTTPMPRWPPKAQAATEATPSATTTPPPATPTETPTATPDQVDAQTQQEFEQVQKGPGRHHGVGRRDPAGPRSGRGQGRDGQAETGRCKGRSADAVARTFVVDAARSVQDCSAPRRIPNP